MRRRRWWRRGLSSANLPVAPDLATRSEPARSMRWSLPRETWLVIRLVAVTYVESMRCERDECSFMSVQAEVRFECPTVILRGVRGAPVLVLVLELELELVLP